MRDSTPAEIQARIERTTTGPRCAIHSCTYQPKRRYKTRKTGRAAFLSPLCVQHHALVRGPGIWITEDDDWTPWDRPGMQDAQLESWASGSVR